jgi:hypothetical protein
VLVGVLLYLLCVLLVSSHRCLDVLLFKKIKDYEAKALSSNKQVVRQVFAWMCSFLSRAVMSVAQVFHHL